MEKIKKSLKKIKIWVLENKVEFILFLTIVAVASFLRLYKISEYMTFLGDEGRDAIIVRRLLVYFDPILVGPGTSIGNMYLGPLYYYLIAPFLFLFNYSPVGPSVMVALLGVATVILIYVVARQWFGKTAAVVASFLYAISPTVIIYSRSSWNPNIMPFFSLVCIYSIWRVWQKLEFKWLVPLGISYAFVLQSHYLGLLLAPTLFVFWLLSYLKTKLKEKLELNSFLKNSVVGLAIFLFLMSPLVIFDARHGWNNFSAMKKFFSERQATVSAKPWNALPKVPIVASKISSRLVSGRSELVGMWMLIAISAASVALVLKRKKLNANELSGFSVLALWLAFALIGLGLYKQEIYDHYYGFFFTAPSLLIGGFVGGAFGSLSKLGKVVLISSLLVLVYLNLINSPLKDAPNKQMQRSREVASKIAQESRGTPFNLAVIAERNYEDGYQYFLEKDGLPVVDIDAQVPETVKDQLFVVCEMEKSKCDPTHSSKAEVANFGWSKIDGQWEVFGVNIFKLVHTQ